MNNKMLLLTMLVLIAGIVLFHTARSHNASPVTSDRAHYSETPLFRIRLLQVEQETRTPLQTFFMQHSNDGLRIPVSTHQDLPRTTQKFYTSFHTGACVHPTSCPCITSGVFCAGKPTCGVFCMSAQETQQIPQEFFMDLV